MVSESPGNTTALGWAKSATGSLQLQLQTSIFYSDGLPVCLLTLNSPRKHERGRADIPLLVRSCCDSRQRLPTISGMQGVLGLA
eukprot:scaffold59704_cov35-Cyclotella_meneghiniana.AAC.6